jgi:hypothetical protein
MGIIGTGGFSDESRMVTDLVASERQHLRESYVLGAAGNDAFRQLCTVVNESGFPNWDGYGALPISEQTFILACQFLRTIPLGTPAPDVGVEPDGQVTLEWHLSAYRTLSVSVSPDGNLHYSALIGPNTVYGTEAFLGDIPQSILQLIRRVNGG